MLNFLEKLFFLKERFFLVKEIEAFFFFFFGWECFGNISFLLKWIEMVPYHIVCNLKGGQV
jgi:hypothetical protein